MQRRAMRRGFRPKRPSQWIAIGGVSGGYSPSPAAKGAGAVGAFTLVDTIVAAAGAPPAIERFTVECIRGSVCVEYLPAALGDDFTVSLGIMVITGTVAGGVVLPNPYIANDAGMPWLWLHHENFYTAAAGGVADVVTVGNKTIEVNVRSKRVMREDQRLVMCFFVNQNSGGGAINIGPAVRTLISRVA